VSSVGYGELGNGSLRIVFSNIQSQTIKYVAGRDGSNYPEVSLPKQSKWGNSQILEAR